MNRSDPQHSSATAQTSRVLLLLCIAFGLLTAASPAGASPITVPVTRIVPLHIPAKFRGRYVHAALGSFTPNGDLWLEVRRPGTRSLTTLVEVNPRTGREVEAVDTEMRVATAMVVGPNGVMWFGGYQLYNPEVMLGSVTPAGRVSFLTLPIEFAATLPGIVSVAAGPGGEVWFTGDEFTRSGLDETAVGHVTMAGKLVITSFPQIGSWYSGLVATPRGRLYSTGYNTNGQPIPMRLPLTGTRVTRLAASLTLESSDEAGDVLGWGQDRPARTMPDGRTRYYDWQAGSGAAGEPESGAITQGSDGSFWFTASGTDGAVPTDPVLGRIALGGKVTTWPTAVAGTDQFPLGDEYPANEGTEANMAPTHQDALIPGPDGGLYAVGTAASTVPNAIIYGPVRLPWHLYETTIPNQPVMRAPKVRLVSARRSGHHVTVRLSCRAQPGRYCAGTITVTSGHVVLTQSYADVPGMTQVYSLDARSSLRHGARVSVTVCDPGTGRRTTVLGWVG